MYKLSTTVHTVHFTVPCEWCTPPAWAKGTSVQSEISQLFICESLLKSETVLTGPTINVVHILCQVQIGHIPRKRALRPAEWRNTSISAFERKRPWGGKKLQMQWQLHVASTSLWIRAETWTQELKWRRKAEEKAVRNVFRFSTGLQGMSAPSRMSVNVIIAVEKFHWLRKGRSIT